MSGIQYKITMDGTLAPGVTLEYAQNNLAALFKKDISAVKHLFSGKPNVIKRDIDSATADKYIDALFNAGVVAVKESDALASLTLESIESDPATTTDSTHTMTCPKCATQQPTDAMCQSCGIVIAKFNSYQAQSENRISSAPDYAAATGSISPYASPHAQIDPQGDEVCELNIWGVEGRLGRMRYIAWSMVLSFAVGPAMLLCMLLMQLSTKLGGLLVIVTAIAAMVVGIQISVKRLHDIGWSGWLLLLGLIPVVGSIFQLLTFLLPGSTGSNRFGAPPPENSTAVKVLFWIWAALMILAVIGIIAAFAMGIALSPSMY